MKPTTRKYAWVVACLLVAGSALAHDPEHGDALVDHLKDADLVFRGVVTNVEYRNSDGDHHHASIPHTFVTFDVEHLYKPAPPAPPAEPSSIIAIRRITLRFLGGLDQDPDRYMIAAEAPGFDVGDHDFLLVERNGQDACPLVDCEGGRFRAVGGAMYNNDGQEVILTPDGEMKLGPRATLPEIDTDMIGPNLVARTINDEAPEGGASTLPRPAGHHMTDIEFDAFLEQTLQTQLTEEERTRIPRLRWTDPSQPFSVDYAREVKPAEPADLTAPLPESLTEPMPASLTQPPASLLAPPPPPPSAIRAKSDAEAAADTLEVERLHQNGDDPRFK